MDEASGAVDVADGLAGDQLDGVGVVPGGVVDDDVVEGFFAGEDRAEHDAVVVGVGLGAEDGDAEFVGSTGEDLLDGSHSGHAVADDDEAAAFGGDRVHGGKIRDDAVVSSDRSGGNCGA